MTRGAAPWLRMGTRPARSALHARRSRDVSSSPVRVDKGRRGASTLAWSARVQVASVAAASWLCASFDARFFSFQSRTHVSPAVLEQRGWRSDRCMRMDDRAGRVHIRSHGAAPRENRTPPGQLTKPRFQLVFARGGGHPLAQAHPQGPGEKRGRPCAWDGRCSSFAALTTPTKQREDTIRVPGTTTRAS
jgi:hypothetical protein